MVGEVEGGGGGGEGEGVDKSQGEDGQDIARLFLVFGVGRQVNVEQRTRARDASFWCF